MKLLIGGSPCTHWSIAQTKNRETTAEGVGWELFRNYAIARDKYKPDYFLYENNKSMSAAIREQITRELGVEPVLINSALVSAQNRQRLYWVGRREPDGTYSQVHIEQPEDRGIPLRDILETGVVWQEKGYTLRASAGEHQGVGNIVRGIETNGKFSYTGVAEPLATTGDGKAYCVTATEGKGETPERVLTKHQRTAVAEPILCDGAAMRQVGRRINEQGHRDDYNPALPHIQRYEVNDDPQKTNCLTTVEKDNMVALRVGDMPNASGEIRGGQAHRVYDSDGKAVALTARPNGGGVDGPLYASPVMAEHAVDAEKNQTVSHSIDEIVEKKGHLPEMFNPYNRAEIKGKSPTLSTGSMVTSSCATLVVEELEQPDAPVRIGTIENAAKNPDHDSQQYRVYGSDAKCVTLCGGGGGIGAKTGLYATPASMAWRGHERNGNPSSFEMRGDGKSNAVIVGHQSRLVIEGANGKRWPVYEVRNGFINIKSKWYPIKLRDGYYIIRKLTVAECKRLQTVPDEYEFPVSDTQAYKMLGNGWTCDVIAHIMSHFEGVTTERVEVLSMYDGMSCGHIALDKLGAHITAYYATEIDKYAIQTTQHNYPDTVQLGDAFGVRDDGWKIPAGTEGTVDDEQSAPIL